VATATGERTYGSSEFRQEETSSTTSSRMVGMCKFRVNDTFALEPRRLFVLAGSIIEGQIRAGMFVKVPLNSSLLISGQIHSVEVARRTDGREDVCLCITYEDPDELAAWNDLNIQNETLDVVPF
jgi:hypothetical protein